MRTIAIIELKDDKLRIILPKDPESYAIGEALKKRLKE